MSKYNAKKTEVDGIVFDSKKEANRYKELKLLERGGAIVGLKRQVKFELIPSMNLHYPRIRKASLQRKETPINYYADFTYYENGVLIVEDVKGLKTPEYVMKRKLMLFKYDIQIRET